ncbi:hypothetical protein ACJJIW_11230 [Microbulbifer sp. JMSA004]|uniref:hypothetical protein n=1 Tax=unclassified Microbulbifer TaxID=2619833 RepID=UPI0024AD5AB9|nr:hypothetical protein [Microbulbifer sp. VAAF005]WHI45858.1 hypothetical protein P0078_19380 [Microbulbifer sp. VAAF005]
MPPAGYHYDALDRLSRADSPNPEYFVHGSAHSNFSDANSKDEAKQRACTTQVKDNCLTFFGNTDYRYDIH